MASTLPPVSQKEAVLSTRDSDENGHSTAMSSQEWGALDAVAKEGFTVNDQLDMKRMGKKQEFRRNFRFLTTVGFTCCVMGTWEILLVSNIQGLLAGGSAGLFWSLVWAYMGQALIVLSLAEMSSMAPTAGGQYHWVSEFAPASYQRLLSYISGWLATISWQSVVALDCYLVGLIIQSLISINNPDYVPTRWQATLLIFASAIGIGMFNVFAAKHLPLAEGIFVTGHFFAFFPIVIVILVLGPKRSAADVFLNFSDNGAGWPSVGWATMVGQVSAMFAVIGSDSVAHMAEEVEDAGVIVPRSMWWSFLVNIPWTFGLLISYLFCMPNVADAVADPSGFPFIYVFSQATKSTGGTTGMTIVVELLIIMITISTMASTSRQTFAFARDRGLPFASWIGAVHPGWHIPVNAIIVTVLYTMAVSLINIGSTAAFNAIISLSTVALMGTYVISIGCVALKRFRGHPLPPARWSLGRWGLLVNSAAVVYAFYAFFWGFWPNAYQPDAVSFNYACVLFVGLMALSAVLYFAYARRVYEGPVAKVAHTM